MCRSLMPCRTADLIEAPQHPQIVHKPSEAPRTLKRKRKRKRKRELGQETGHFSPQDEDRPAWKRPRTSPSSCTAEERAANISEKSTDPIQYWIRTGRWQEKYFEQDSQVREDLEHDSWLEEQMEESNQVVQYVEINGS